MIPACLKGVKGERVIVDLRDLTSNETLMTAAVEQVLPSGVLQIKQLGEEEMREFVRVFAWLEMSHEVLEDGMAEVGLEEMVDPDFGEPLPEMTHLQMKSLARSEEASEAVLYLIQAVQALDRKLEAVSILTKQLIDRTRSGSMARRKVSISGSGLLFFDDAAYDLGAKLSLRIRLPLRRPVQLHAVAEVVRVDKEIDPELNEPRYGIACKFTNIRESDRERRDRIQHSETTRSFATLENKRRPLLTRLTSTAECRSRFV